MSQETSTLEVLRKLGLIRTGWAPTFEEFVRVVRPLLNELFRAIPSSPDVSSMAQLLYAICVIHSAGNPVFKLTANLARLLQETDLPGDMGLEFLRLPFEGINLDFPAGTLRPPMDKVTRLFLVHAPGDRFRIICTPNEEDTHFVSVQTTGEGSIEDAVIETRKKAFAGVPKEVEEEMRRNFVYEDYFVSDFFVFPINAALYIMSVGADVEDDKSEARALHQELQGLKKSSRREKLEAKLAAAKQHKIFICGRKLSVQKEFMANLTEEGRKLTKRFRVRGFWRNQACGPQWSEHKHLFVAPHWRGPSYSELLERHYVVRSSWG